MAIKRKKPLRFSVFLLLVVCFTQFSYAQLHLDTSLRIDEMVQEILLSENSDMLLKNVQFEGRKYAIASFTVAHDEGFMKNGLILSTGNVFDAKGPNEKAGTSGKTSGRSDQDLQAMATGVVTDAAVLSFDLLALRDSLSFEYVFASEEYPEYIDKGVNDVFGFFIKKKDSKSLVPDNIAKLEDGQTTVSIDNINHRRNSKYFLKSDYFNAHSVDFWRKHPKMALRARTYEFDGFTVPLNAVVKLEEGQWYHFKIAIADVGDRLYDSAVLLKAKSFTAKGKKIPRAAEIVKNFVFSQLQEIENWKYDITGKKSFDLKIQFNSNEAIIQKSSFPVLDQLVQLLNNFPSLKLKIIGHTDNRGSKADNLALSKGRSKAVFNYLKSKNINPKRLKVLGMGESDPVSNNKNETGRLRNRRVEFELIY